ncbi:hypothetical protein EDD18DRAFT_1008768, partial [Armillaria luteobubalina]
EPPLSMLNNYMTPLVDAFLEFWEPGVRFSRTQLYPQGRLVRCALIVVICDLPAARKVGGFAPFNHRRFCSMCWCTLESHGYGNVMFHEWKRRTNDDCRAWANRFHDVNPGDYNTDKEYQKALDSIYDRSGMWWSELLRLPYFDPSRHIVVDAMHNLFLGLIKEHFEGILG